MNTEELAILCEKFKQERDEARKELEEYRSIAENIGAKKAVSEKEKAIQERDEAIELLKLCADYTLTTHKEEVEKFLNKIKDADGYTLIHAVCVLQNERDELLAKLSTSQTQTQNNQ